MGQGITPDFKLALSKPITFEFSLSEGNATFQLSLEPNFAKAHQQLLVAVR